MEKVEDENYALENTKNILSCVKNQHENTIQRNNHLDTKISNLYLVVLAIVPLCVGLFDVNGIINSESIFDKILIALFLVLVLFSWVILLHGSLQKKFIYRFGIEDYEELNLSDYSEKKPAEMNVELIKHYSEAIHKNSSLIKLKVKTVKKTQSCLFAAIVVLLLILILQIF